MNKVILIGRLFKDVEMRLSGEISIARYGIAVDRFGKDKGADFINCVAFGKAAEFAEKYLHKGMKIAIEGRIQTGSYENKEGKKVYTTDVIVNSHEFCEKKGQEKPVESDEDFYSIPDGIEGEFPFGE